MTAPKPTTKPKNPCFSSGPTAKRPGWTVDALKGALLGRSHRAGVAKNKLADVINRSKKLLGIPENYVVGIMPASDTGAFEAAMWSLLGPRPVDVFAWESFGLGWVSDVVKQLKLKDVNTYKAAYGELPDMSKANPAHDIIFTWNGTTGGVCVPNGDFIAVNREGLTLCDATSAAFAMPLPWDKLDCTTWSWQKCLGGEAQHGMIALSPRAVERLQSYTPAWPMPKIFLMAKDGKLLDAIFKGDTINTPSMLCVEDALDGLTWAEGLGLAGLQKRAQDNLAAITAWVEKTPWAEFLAKDPAIRSCTSICVKLADPAVAALNDAQQADFVKTMCGLIEKEGAGFDLAGHRDAPPHIRIWGGSTVDTADITAILPWLDWAFEHTKAQLKAAA